MEIHFGKFNFWKLCHILLSLSLEISMNFLEIVLLILIRIYNIYNTLKNVIQILDLTLLVLSVELIIQIIETVFSIQVFRRGPQVRNLRWLQTSISNNRSIYFNYFTNSIVFQ